ncbi:NLR family CARD domain-containing protein 4-like [Amphiura filiformis]|uniref:NLR family CARD domain-containing protein 4-like n=1 Tax=Amphiura filiformis TaxID=82378 RepID=UPI003B21E2D1
MTSIETENYVRCHQAVQLVCAEAIPCIQNVLTNWHKTLQQRLKPCISPQTCPTKGKPKNGKGSCNACVDWGDALEKVVYPPNSSGTLPWANINPTLLHTDPIEAAKVFVLRLQPGAVYTDVGDFDSASLIMIMMKFVEFHQGDVATYDTIKKVAHIRNHLSHIKVNTNLKLDDTETDGYFQDLSDFVTCLNNAHPQYYPQATARQVIQTLQEIRMDTFDIDVCRQELVRVYEEDRGKVSLFPFDIESTVDIDDVFVDLELLEESFLPGIVSKVPLKTYDELFSLKKKGDKDKPVLRVLLKGDAGSGKTTLAGKIAYDWSQCVEGNASPTLSKFTLLFCLKMRYFDHDISLVDAIFDQLLPSDSKVSKGGLHKYIVDNAEKVAVILDGADEFSGKIERSPQGNLVMDVVCNKMLCNSCVVVTTRPQRVTSVREFSQYSHVEVKGFNEEGIFEFIGKFFKVRSFKNAKELYEHIIAKHDNPQDRMNELQEDLRRSDEDSDDELEDLSISTMSHDQVKNSVAVFIETIFYNYPFMKSMACIPVVLTMFCLLWHEAKKLPERFTSLYQEVLHYMTQRWLEKTGNDTGSDEIEDNITIGLGKVALMCLFEDRLFFSSQEFGNPDILETSRRIGILVEERKRSKLHMVKQYSFIHKTFQEFCAASYWASLAESSEEKFSNYLSRISPLNAICILMSMGPDKRKQTTRIRTFSSNCRFDFVSMANFLSYSYNLKELSLTIPCLSFFESMRSEEPLPSIDMFKLFLLIANMKELSTLYLLLSGESLKDTNLFVEILFCKLESLSLVYGKEDVAFWKSVFRNIAHQNNITLRKLVLSNNVLGGETIKISASPVYIPQPHRLTRQVEQVRDPLHGIFEWLSTALSLHKMDHSILIENSVEEFSDVLQNMPNLEKLELSSTCLVPRDISFVAKGISCCTKLKSLDISDNNISDACSDLSRALQCLPNLSDLQLNRTKLSDIGIAAVGNALSCLQDLKYISLSGNGITFKGIYSLSNVLPQLPEMLMLNVSSNPIGDLGVVALCASFEGMPLLECLGLDDCAISNAGALVLSLSIQYVANLRQLSVGQNEEIGPEGITWLFESLKVVTKLREVRLDGITLECLKCDKRLMKIFKELRWDPQNKYSRSDECVESKKYEMNTLTVSGIRKVIKEF